MRRSEWPGRKALQRSQGALQGSLVGFAKALLAGGLRQVPPRHGGFQLVAAGRSGPAEGVARRGDLSGQRDDRVQAAIFTSEIGGHGFAQRCRHVQELLLAGGAPYREQPADHDAAVEEVGGGGRIDFERHRARAGIPCLAGEKTRGAEGRLEPPLVPGESVQIHQRGNGIARDLGGNRVVALKIRAIVAGYAAIRFLDARAQEPLAGASEMGRQTASVTFGPARGTGGPRPGPPRRRMQGSRGGGAIRPPTGTQTHRPGPIR